MKKQKPNNRTPSVYESGDSQTLYLTNNRTSQQISSKAKDNADYLRKIKISEMRNKKFYPLKYPPHFCNEERIAFITCENGKPKKVKYSKIPCNSWRCPTCGPKKAKQAKIIISEVAVLNKLHYFLTLTLDPEKIPEKYKQNTHKYITKIFNHFGTVLKRSTLTYFHEGKNREYSLTLNHAEKKLKYIWVIEYQDNGNAHMHLLINRFLPIDQIRKIWTHVGGGVQMHIEKVRSIRAVGNYISSYIAKGMNQKAKNGEYYFNYFQKRYVISQSCERPTKHEVLPLSKDTGDNLMNKLEKDNLVGVYNKLQDEDYTEEEIDL